MQRFWVWPIALYLFLGGLGGGMMTFAAVLGCIVAPSAITSAGLVWGVFVAFLCLGIGTGLLVFELGQPPIFYRAFVTRTAVIKWGAVVLSVSMIFGVLFIFWEITWLSALPCIPYEGFARFCLAIAGIAGACVMVYTGVLLSSMKSRPFWNTPALPVLFAVSALSTGAALLGMCVGHWPFPAEWLFVPFNTVEAQELFHEQVEFLHIADRVLIIVEICVLLLFVLLQFCASNKTAKMVAGRWLRGSWALYFWVLMLGCGLVLPFLLNLAGGMAGSIASPLIALAGGCLLRFMIVWSNDRRHEPGEVKFYTRLPQGHDHDFMYYWDEGREYWTWSNAEAPAVEAAEVETEAEAA